MRKGCVPLASVASITLLLSGCQLFGDDSPRVDRSSGPLADESYQWTGAPGIDLRTGAAVPVRAYVESRADAQTMGSLDYVYPGFERAVAAKPDDRDADMFTVALWPDERERRNDVVRVGNDQYRILSLHRTGETAFAVLCHYRYGLALERDDGTYVSVLRDAVDDDGIDALLIRMTAPREDADPLPPQEGPAPAPSVDVFGDWKITGLLSLHDEPDPRYAEAWPSQEADLARCVAEAPDPPERRAFLATGVHPRSDFPTSPPSPGWPEQSR